MHAELVLMLRTLVDLGGMLSLSLAGVRLHLDHAAESFFLETEPGHDRDILRSMLSVASDVGYEVMPEWECPPEELPGGVLRHWMTERWDASEPSVLQAV